MTALTRTARLTGAAYLTLALVGMAGFLLIRPQLRGDDPAGTLALLRDHERLAQLGIALELLIVIAQACAAVGFFALLQRDRPGAAYAVSSFGMANAVAILASAALLITASTIAANESLAPAGDAAAAAGLAITIADAFWAVGAVFFGLWLIPLGWYALSTTRMPRVLGWFLVVGGAGYAVSCFVGVLAPGIPSAITDVLTIPATIAEFWVIAYLLIVGIRAPKRESGAVVGPAGVEPMTSTV